MMAVRGIELYDLENDPGECINLIDNRDFADVRADLQERLFAWYDPWFQSLL